MVEFIIMIIILVICGLLFGKTDTKKEMLNWVGLDLSERNYMNKKGNEFHSYSIKAMKAVVDLDYYDAQNEMDFLDFIMTHSTWLYMAGMTILARGNTDQFILA